MKEKKKGRGERHGDESSASEGRTGDRQFQRKRGEDAVIPLVRLCRFQPSIEAENEAKQRKLRRLMKIARKDIGTRGSRGGVKKPESHRRDWEVGGGMKSGSLPF